VIFQGGAEDDNGIKLTWISLRFTHAAYANR
jgi:hypothetical protein